MHIFKFIIPCMSLKTWTFLCDDDFCILLEMIFALFGNNDKFAKNIK